MGVLDREIRRAGLPGFNSLVLLRLAARPDVDALRAALGRDDELARWIRAPVRHTFPLRRPYRDAGCPAPPPRVDVLDGPPAGESEPWPSLLATALRPGDGENVRFVVFPVADDGWRVAFLFNHLLADAKAAERLLVHLPADARPAAWPDARSLLGDTGFRDLALAARDQADSIERDAAGPLHLVAGPRGKPTGRCGAASVALDAESTARAVAAGRRASGYAMEGLWYLACALAADRDTETSPPRPGARYAVPLPTSLDRKGETRALGNNLVFLFLAAPVDDARDPVALAKRFRERMLRHLKERGDRGSQAQLEFGRRLPAGLNAWIARRTVGGGWGSLFFTNPGPVPAGLARFLGADVLDVAHFPIPAPDPGVCAAVWSWNDRLRLGATWLEGAVDGGRVRAWLQRWRERIVETPA